MFPIWKFNLIVTLLVGVGLAAASDVTVYMNDPRALVFTGNRKVPNGPGLSVWGSPSFYSDQCGGTLEAGADFDDNLVTFYFTGTRVQVNFIGQNKGSPQDGGHITINGTTVATVTTYSSSPVEECTLISATISDLPHATHQLSYIQEIGPGLLHSFVYTPYYPKTKAIPTEKKASTPVGPIVAVVLGGLAAIAATVAVLIWFFRRRAAKKEAAKLKTAADAEAGKSPRSSSKSSPNSSAKGLEAWSPNTLPRGPLSLESVKEEE